MHTPFFTKLGFGSELDWANQTSSKLWRCDANGKGSRLLCLTLGSQSFFSTVHPANKAGHTQLNKSSWTADEQDGNFCTRTNWMFFVKSLPLMYFLQWSVHSLIVLISSLSFEYRLPPRDDILRLVAVIGQVSNGKGGKIRPFPIHTVRVHILIYERSDSHSRPRYST